MSAEDRSGETLGSWRLLEILGVGAFATVYRGQHAHLPSKQAALKVLHSQGCRDEAAERRFLAEAEVLARINHPAITQIYDIHIGDPAPCFIVMELLEGQTLRKAQEGGLRDPDEVVRLTIQLVDALERAHAAGIVHRDLKPENIFVMQAPGVTPTIKLLDFGIAKLTKLTSAGGTMTKGPKGTPRYMPPEQCQARPDVDGRADVYALGVVLYEWLAGEHPFPKNSIYGLLTAHLMEPPPPHPRLDTLHPSLRALIFRMLAKEPVDRPQTMQEVRQVLETVANEARPAEQPRPARHAPLLAGPAPLPRWLLLGVGLLSSAALLWAAAPLLRGGGVAVDGGVVVDGGVAVDGSVAVAAPVRYRLQAREVSAGEFRTFVRLHIAAPQRVLGEIVGVGAQPVRNVTRHEAQRYCALVSPRGRLPTEAEWDQAAQPPGGQAGVVPEVNADGIPQQRLLMDPGPVDRPSLRGGLFDGVAEWVSDESNGRAIARGGFEGLVIQGGTRQTYQLSPLARLKANPNRRYQFIGFRCAERISP